MLGLSKKPSLGRRRHDHMEERGMSSMNGNPSDQPNVAWERLPWKKLEVTVYRMQKRIFQASKRGDTKTVHKIQKLLMRVRSGKTPCRETSNAGQPGKENRRSRRSEIRPASGKAEDGRSHAPHTDAKPKAEAPQTCVDTQARQGGKAPAWYPRGDRQSLSSLSEASPRTTMGGTV